MPIEVPTHERGCPFCGNLEGRNQVAILDETPDTYAFLNPRQFGKGHTLVIPKRHAPTVLDLQAEEVASLMTQVHRLASAISKAFDPSGLNIFQNNGLTAGQMVAHYHVHIVPSYPGDPPGGRIFRSDDFERVPIEERMLLVEQIRRHLA
jgi:histidine triad (HIT) family protein